MAANAFSGFDLRTGCLFDGMSSGFPSMLYGFAEDLPLELSNPNWSDTFFGYVFSGRAHLEAEHNTYKLVPGQYFCVSESIRIQGGRGIVVRRAGFRGQNQIGGPIEPVGRLRYIDGCTDSLLVAPTVLGAPCLNALYFPCGIDQTAHTHPSMRVGIVVRGSGRCVTDKDSVLLSPGMAFVIHEDGLHKFQTGAREGMTVIAYHPDSDFGPVDSDHPMINRTIVNGVSAALLDGLHTKEVTVV